jgi:protein-S-isoprenylcysteine O-methyltransferase Ste14
LVYLIAATGLFHRQVLREEQSMTKLYGNEFAAYRQKVPRYL